MAVLRVKVGVGANAVVHPSADQGMHGPVAIFAENIPTGDFKPRERAHHGQIWALRKPGGIGAAEHQLDILGVLTLHMTAKDIRDHGSHRFRPDRGCIDLSPAGDAGVGGEFYQDPIPPTPTGRRWAGDDHVEVLQFHKRCAVSCFGQMKPGVSRIRSRCVWRCRFWCRRSRH